MNSLSQVQRVVSNMISNWIAASLRLPILDAVNALDNGFGRRPVMGFKFVVSNL